MQIRFLVTFLKIILLYPIQGKLCDRRPKYKLQKYELHHTIWILETWKKYRTSFLGPKKLFK